MELYHPDPEETNYMIVIGDAGDHQNPEKIITFIEEEQIVDNLAEYNMNMLAYQVHRTAIQSADNPYQDFENQLKRIMLEAANKSRKQSNIPETEVILFESSGNNFFKLNSQSPVTGEFVIVTPDAAMTVQQLESNLTDAIQKIDKLITEFRKKIEEVLEGSPNSEESIAKIISYLKNSGINSQDAIRILSGLHQTYQEGYTLMKPANASYPWFQYVLLIERKDLDYLNEAVRQSIRFRDYPASMQRTELIEGWQAILMSVYRNLSKPEIRQIPIGNWFQCFTSFPLKWKYSNLTIFDMMEMWDPEITSDVHIKVFIEELSYDLEKTSKAIEEIYRQGEKYPHIEFPGNSNEIYYWVPVDIFPHD